MAKHRKATTKKKKLLKVTGVAAGAGAVFLGVPQIAAHADPGPNWGPIISCESGGNAQAQNRSSTASGLYQFLDSTWRALGGNTARAKDASVAEQTRIANKQYAISGFTAWAASKSCWAGKTGSGPAIKNSAKASPAPKPHDRVHANPAPRVAVPHAVATGSRSYTVKAGDTLSKIAQAKYGDMHRWREIYQANVKTVGGNPNLILPGQVLTLP